MHTKGPWDLRDYDKRIGVGIGLVEGPHGYDVAEVYNDNCDPCEAEANARLIAASPELLELAWQYLSDLRRPPVGDSLQRRIKRAEQVIAKATGA